MARGSAPHALNAADPNLVKTVLKLTGRTTSHSSALAAARSSRGLNVLAKGGTAVAVAWRAQGRDVDSWLASG
jgi:hypothetical protein